jgi:hypothetical protein
MKYAILGPQDSISRVRDTAPPAGVRHVEVTDEQAAAIAGLTRPIWLDGQPTTRADVLATGDRVRWDADLGKLVRFTPPPPAPPAAVPLWAFRQVLIEEGLLASVQAAVAQSATLTNFLEYGNFVDRASPALASLATALGKTPADVDAMFRRAGALKL